MGASPLDLTAVPNNGGDTGHEFQRYLLQKQKPEFVTAFSFF
jgi:hypothetical protein